MAISSLYQTTKIRMTGMSSGLDTDSIIQQTLKLRQMKIDTQTRARTKLEWQQQAYTGIKDEITALQNLFLRSTGTSSLLNRNNYNSTAATVTGTNAGAVTVKTTSDSTLGTMRIGQVVSLAKGANAAGKGNLSTASVTGGASVSVGSGTTELSDVRFETGREIEFDTSGNATATINGKEITFNSGDSAQIILDQINDGVAAGEEIEFDTNGEAKININGTEVTLNENTDDGAKMINNFNDAIGGKINFDGNGEAKININGKEITLSADETIDDMLNKINNDADAGVTMDFAGGKFTLTGDTAGASSSLSFLDNGNFFSTLGLSSRNVSGGSAGISSTTKLGDLRFENGGKINFDVNGNADIVINGKTIALNKDDSVTGMINKINNSGAGATMKYDRIADQFTIESNTVGDSSKLKFSDGGNFFESLGLGTQENTDIANGSSAQVYINGNLVEQQSNTFNYRGASITLNNTTTTGGTGLASDQDATVVELKRDTTEAVKKIKDFVTAYNSIIGKIEGYIKDRQSTKEKKYTPLTDEEKKEMTETQIKDWEAIAKKGILKNDVGLSNLASSLRSALYETVEGFGVSPSDIGLRTGSYKDGGQILLDEERLTAALEEDPDRVANIMAGVDGNKGFLYRANEKLSSYVNVSQKSTLSSLEDTLRRSNEKIDDMQNKLYKEEERLYLQYAAMEKALAEMQNSSNMFSSLMGG